MNTTTIYPSEHSWLSGHSRRASVESALSIQGKETDYVRDTSDTDCSSDKREYEPVTEPEDELSDWGSSGQSDNEIIATKVIAVCVRDDGELQLADSEQTDSEGSDSEMDLHDYWECAQCRAANNNPLYRYCEKCFRVRKNFFPPRPKRRNKRLNDNEGTSSTRPVILGRPYKRRAESADRCKTIETDTSSDSDTEPLLKKARSADPEVAPLVKTVSDPGLTIESVRLTKKAIINSLKEKIDDENLCIICYTVPKSAVFVHGRIAHICCCYECANRVWRKAKRCPQCNCKVSNVLKVL